MSNLIYNSGVWSAVAWMFSWTELSSGMGGAYSKRKLRSRFPLHVWSFLENMFVIFVTTQ